MVFNVANNVVEELFLLCVNPKIIPGQPITTVVNVEANADICRMNPLINTEGFAPIRIKCFLKCSFNFFYIAASYIVKESLNDCFISTNNESDVSGFISLIIDKLVCMIFVLLPAPLCTNWSNIPSEFPICFDLDI